MSEDKLHDQIQRGHQARALREPLVLACEELKEYFVKHLLQCKTDEMEKTRMAINMVDHVVRLIDNQIANAGQAQHQLELKAIEEGRHRIYGVG